MTQNEALAILKTGANVFLTGEPGSGKTHTVNQYVAYLREHSIEPAITASTGIAATHIGGYTVHSWSGIGVKRDLTPYDLDAIASNKRVWGRVRNTSVLIIDEVSMLSASTLEMVDAVCQEVRRERRPFGGLQVVLVGDFFQLPPVTKREEKNEEEIQLLFDEGPRFACDATAWGSLHLIPCYLSEQHRQEDKKFLDFLSAVRRAEVTPVHRALLKERFAGRAREGVTELYSHNANVDTLNGEQLRKLPGTARQFQMGSWGSERLVAGLKRGCLSPEVLSLKVGARVMFTKNDTITGRFANGTLGTVAGFDSSEGYPMVKTNSGSSVVAEPMEWNLQDAGKVLARVEQVPLRLAWAMTIHKSQGMSLDAAHMDLSNTFEYGQGYVALSRVRTLKGLSLAGFNDRALEVHPAILEKDVEFRAESEQAREIFARLSAPELKTMQRNFIRACGGREAK